MKILFEEIKIWVLLEVLQPAPVLSRPWKVDFFVLVTVLIMEIWLKFYFTSSLLFGSTSLVQGCKIARNTIENEKLRAELKEIQSELKQLKENNMDDTMGMGR